MFFDKSANLHIKIQCVVPENVHINPKDGHLLKIPRWRGGLKCQNFKAKYEAKLEIPDGWEGLNQTTILGGAMDIF